MFNLSGVWGIVLGWNEKKNYIFVSATAINEPTRGLEAQNFYFIFTNSFVVTAPRGKHENMKKNYKGK